MTRVDSYDVLRTQHVVHLGGNNDQNAQARAHELAGEVRARRKVRSLQ